jgi:predicted ATPase/signal transduction histidine kinase
MPTEVARYRVTETLLASERRLLYRGVRVADERRVLIMVLGPRHALLRDVQRLEHARQIGEQLAGVGALRPLALDRFQGLPALVTDDPGGQPLSSLLTQPLPVGRFLRLAVPLASAVAEIHTRGVIHKDLHPASFLVDEVAGRVWILDFQIASVLPREHLVARNPLQLEGTLAYMSPEQTGRMNRALDHRSDLYSLGVTFYQALTGRLPFTARDPLEWVFCHVARAPQPPGESLPGPLAELLLKLLAKEAEQRYQSASGLTVDLGRCRVQWESSGRIDRFPLGELDGPDQLVVPQRLYGRQAESDRLLAAFQRVARSGQTEVVMVSGAAGTGKSLLVHELLRPVSQAQGFFLAGKFELIQTEVPHAPMVQAFRELILDLLTESDDKIAGWRGRLLAALHGNGILIADLIPQLGLIIGPQPALEPLRPGDAQHRFEMVMRNFIAAFPTPDRPVVLFLDDMQWADGASLRLIEQLARSAEVRYLLLVGAYRGNEVDVRHPLWHTHRELARSPTPLLDIELAPLTEPDLRALVADSVGRDDAPAAELSALVHNRTGGNPFFAVQLLETLSREGLIGRRDADGRRWGWQLEEIAARPTTGDVVDFLVEKVKRLPAPEQELLVAAAYLGDPRPLEVLEALCARPAEEIQHLLVRLTREGLLARVADAYRFVHDRVLQAAYSLIPEGERPQAHLRVGRLLLAQTPEASRPQVVFGIVGQLNRGAALLTDLDEVRMLAELNLTAGLKAKAANAQQSAIRYLTVGMELLERSVGAADRSAVWRSFYPLAYALQLARAECELLNHDLEQALQRSSELVEHARTAHDKLPAYLLQKDAYLVQGRLLDAHAAERACWLLFGIDLPAEPSQEDLARSLARVRELLGDRPIEDIVDLPLARDPDLQAAMRMTSSASFTDQTLYLLHAARMVALSLEHGNAEGSVFWYGCYGYVLAGLGQSRDGHRFARAAYDLREKHAFPTSQAQALFFLGLTAFWTEPLPRSREHTEAALQIWRSTGGPLTGTALATFNHLMGALVAGEPLPRIEEQAQLEVQALRPLGFRDLQDMCQLLLQVTRALQGRTVDLARLQDDSFDEEEFVAGLPQRSFRRLVCWYWIARMRLGYMAGDFPRAREAGDRARELAWSVAGNPALAELTFFHALSLAAAFDEGSPTQREGWLTTLTQHQEQLRGWADDNPSIFRHRYALVLAEMARIGGRHQEAADLYQDSIAEAAAGGFVQHEALAYELFARLRERQGLQAMADLYRMEARARYQRWGAGAKVKKLDDRYPHLAAASAAAGPTTLLLDPEQVDLLSVAQASQAISREVVPDKLLRTLMHVLLTQSGATRGALLVPRDDSWSVAAMAGVQADGIDVRTGSAAAAEWAALPESVLRFTWRTGEVVVLDDAGVDRRFAEDGYIRRQGPRSLLCLPIVKQGERVALLYLENRAVSRAFTPNRLTILGVLAGQVAISLENSLLFEKLTVEIEERKRAEEAVRFLLEAGDALTESLEYQVTLSRLAGLAVTSLADWCLVDVMDESGEIRRVAAAHRDPGKQVALRELRQRMSAKGPPRYAVEALACGNPLIVTDVRETLIGYGYDAESVEAVLALGGGSGMVLPLRARGRVLGSMTLVSALPFPTEGPPALELAQELARRAAVAIDNARLYREAQEAIRLRDEFLSIASHELNTPLATLRLLVEGLETQDMASNPELLSRTMHVLSRQTRRLVGLVAELLNVTRISAGPLHLQLERVDLQGVVTDVVERFSQELSRAQCKVSVRAASPVVGLWDRGRLEQVLTNLLSNAIKFGAGRPIQIAVEGTAAGLARLEVTDEGIGIPADQINRIFGRFSRAVSATHYGGLGLGLYIVSQIVRAFGGSVQVTSGEGLGSTFTVELPLDSSTVTAHPGNRRGETKELT